jgi:hypothetical protein
MLGGGLHICWSSTGSVDGYFDHRRFGPLLGFFFRFAIVLSAVQLNLLLVEIKQHVTQLGNTFYMVGEVHETLFEALDSLSNTLAVDHLCRCLFVSRISNR